MDNQPVDKPVEEIPKTVSLWQIIRSVFNRSFHHLFTFLRSSPHASALQLTLLLIILAAIPLTVTLSQQRQEIRQRAAVNDQGCGCAREEATCRPGEEICTLQEPDCRDVCEDREICEIDDNGEEQCHTEQDCHQECDPQPEKCESGPDICDGPPICVEWNECTPSGDEPTPTPEEQPTENPPPSCDLQDPTCNPEISTDIPPCDLSTDPSCIENPTLTPECEPSDPTCSGIGGHIDTPTVEEPTPTEEPDGNPVCNLIPDFPGCSNDEPTPTQGQTPEEIEAQIKIEELERNRRITSAVELLQDPNIPEEQRNDAIKVVAEAVGVDPNDPTAVDDMLNQLRTPINPAADNSTFFYYSVVDKLPKLSTTNQTPTPEELPVLQERFEQARTIVNTMYGESDDASRINDIYAVLKFLNTGVDPQSIIDKIDTESRNLIDYIEQNGITCVLGLRCGLDLGKIDREAPDNVKVFANALRVYSDVLPTDLLGTESKEKVLEAILPFVKEAVGLHGLTTATYSKNAEQSQAKINDVITYALSNYPWNDEIPDFSRAETAVQPDRMFVLNSQLFDRVGGAVGENRGGLSVGNNSLKPIYINQPIAEQFGPLQSAMDHEWIHRAAQQSDLIIDIENRIELGLDRKTYSELVEATTEVTSILGSNLRGSEEPETAYKGLVSAMRGPVVEEMLKNGFSQDEAYAIIVTAGLTGDYKPMFAAVGSRKDTPSVLRGVSSSSGVVKIKEIFSKVPNVGFTSDVIDYAFGLEKAFAAEKTSIIYVNDKPDISPMPLDKAIAIVNGLSKQKPINFSWDQYDSQKKVIGIVSGDARQKVDAFNASSFQLESKKNITSDVKKRRNGKLEKDEVNNIFASTLMYASTRSTKNGLTIRTGQNGSAVGKLQKGKYRVRITPVEGYDIKISATIDLNKDSNAYIPIAVTTGTGKITYVDYNEPIFARNIFNLRKVFAVENNSLLTMTVFFDKNKNVKLDNNESILPWAGLSLSLIAQAQIIGDINGDGVVDVLDYTILYNCYGNKANSESCGANRTAADLNTDGSIDGIDYNLFVRGVAAQQ